jgi:restriction system protein
LKLKMAENSLFAILLRKRWWVSLLVALGFVGLAVALLPAPHKPLGVVAGFPFFVITAMAVWRQWGQPSDAQVERTLTRLAEMSWAEFGPAVEAAYRREGHEVRRLKGPGADFEISKAGRSMLLSARRWKASRLGAEPLRELQAAVEAQEAQGGICLALGELTEAGREVARDHALVVVQGMALARLLPELGRPPK